MSFRSITVWFWKFIDQWHCVLGCVMKKGPFSKIFTFSAGVFLLFRPRPFRTSTTMRTRSQTRSTRSQTRKAQEQASSSASLGDHFDTPHAGFDVAADVQPWRKIGTPFRPSDHGTCLCTPRASLRLACCHKFQWIALTPGVIRLSPVPAWPLLSRSNCSRKQWILPCYLLFLWTCHCTTGRHRPLSCRRWFWRESQGYLDLRDLFLSLYGTLLTPESSENWTKF
jgi:hypothetical protein